MSQKEYIAMSDEQLRGYLLDNVPLGSSRGNAEKFIGEELRKKINKKDYAVLLTPREYACRIEKDDFTLCVKLASYGWVKNLFLIGKNVESFWLFSASGKLKDVQVLHQWQK